MVYRSKHEEKSFKIHTASGLGVQLIKHQLVTYENLASIPSAGRKEHQGVAGVVLVLCCVLLILSIWGSLKRADVGKGTSRYLRYP